MKIIRCMVCRQTLPTFKMLKCHYLAAHSKLQLVRPLMKSTIRMYNRYKKNVKNSFENVKPQYFKSEILYLEDGFKNTDDSEEDSCGTHTKS